MFMFESKKELRQEIIDANAELAKIRLENYKLNKKIETLEIMNKELKEKNEEEYAENYKLHKKQLKIETIINKAVYGNYYNLLSTIRETKKVLSDSDQTSK